MTGRLDELACRLADDLAFPPPYTRSGYGPDSPRWNGQSLSDGAAGIVLLHGLRSRTGHADWDRVRAWLARAVRDDLSAGDGAGLWHGAPAVAFALLAAAPPGEGEQLLERLDTAVDHMIRRRLDAAHARIDSARRPSPGEFDLVRGLTGLGAYLLRRRPGSPLLREILGYLVRLAEPLQADDPAGSIVPGWWTHHLPAGKPAERLRDGHADNGMAHGIAGPLALLSLVARAGIIADGQIGAIRRMCSWMDEWRHEGAAGPWWPERVTLAEIYAGRSRFDGPARPSWCYGTPGIARAQQLAALALGDLDRQRRAEDALLQCVSDPVQLGGLSCVSLCHGWAGVLATCWFAAAEAAALHAKLRELVEAFPSADDRGGPGLINGSAGAALVLHTLATGTAGAWPAILLIN
jgi:hypothetical protein